MTATDIVIMAAGQGTRMKSQRPKVLHRLAGQPLLAHVLDSAATLGARSAVVITGHGAAEVEAFCADRAGKVQTVRQQPQLGTGHAVQQAAPVLPDDGVTLVLNGDVPLVRADTLRRLIELCAGRQVALLTVDTGADAGAYGRIVRDAGTVRAIVEAKDATPAQRAITEWYSGVMAAPTRLLKKYLALLTNDNAQHEFYLTDVVRHAVADGTPVQALPIADAVEVAGVNSPAQLAALEREVQRRHAQRLLDSGMRLADPERFDLRGDLHCGRDVEIDVGCVFEGQVTLGDDVRIGAHCVIANARIEAGAVIHPFTHIDGGREGVTVGPAALSSTCASKGRPASLCSTLGRRLFMRVPWPAAMMTRSMSLICLCSESEYFAPIMATQAPSRAPPRPKTTAGLIFLNWQPLDHLI
jgi:bifunctional UDP-N-acetylglucosamine pyrophosphorylase/glucosamine-1-phosphate N-acetyltransferase